MCIRDRDEYDLTYMFIAHNLSVAEHISDRVCVMYLGRVAELAETEELFYHPRLSLIHIFHRQYSSFNRIRRNGDGYCPGYSHGRFPLVQCTALPGLSLIHI